MFLDVIGPSTGSGGPGRYLKSLLEARVATQEISRVATGDFLGSNTRDVLQSPVFNTSDHLCVATQEISCVRTQEISDGGFRGPSYICWSLVKIRPPNPTVPRRAGMSVEVRGQRGF